MRKFAVIALSLAVSSPDFGFAQDRASVHGMLVFGKERVYLSHLPMFHNPHDYQAIVEAELPAAAKDAYLRDRAAHPEESVYTLVPERFVLPEMMSQPRPFAAELYRGHFERGGVPIAKVAVTRIKRVVHFRRFDPGATHPARLQYLAFGAEGEETFLAHLITARPDFDHVVEAKGLTGALPRTVVFDAAAPELPLPTGPSLNTIYLETGDLE